MSHYKNILSKLNYKNICNHAFLVLNRGYSSALYITGEKASNTFAVLTPHLDLEERLLAKEALEKNLKFRGYDTKISKLEEAYRFCKSIEEEISVVDGTRTEIAKQLNKLLKNSPADTESILRLKTQANLAKNEYRHIRERYQGFEESTALKILDLPNVLHPKTPFENEVTHLYLDKPNTVCEAHLKIAALHNLVEYISEAFVILKGDAALFELGVANFFQSRFLDLQYTQFSNCDFVRSVVLEGCGTPNFDAFTLDYASNEVRNLLTRDHLVGGASIQPFMAYFAKNSIQTGFIPLRLFASGRIYKPSNHPNKSTSKNSLSNPSNSLFALTQSTGMQIFIAVKDSPTDEETELNSVVEIVKALYESFGVHFRVCRLSPSLLDKSESLRLSFQMFSPHQNSYIEVGNISLYEKYLSKRLLFTYSENKERKFLRVISGTILNVQKVLGCVIENNAANRNDLIPVMFQNFVPL